MSADLHKTLRIHFAELLQTLTGILEQKGFSAERAQECARLFAETTRDGVYSHGVNRFPRFLSTIENGAVIPGAEPQLVSANGALERWDGKYGPGNLNAQSSMARAIALAHEHGIGCVALAHTNHWMRGGSYGWQAADAGMIALCWTNTLPNLPAWGATTASLGNNPLVIAAPRAGGHLVLDMAISQFSYGALTSYRERGEMLPVPGGFDSDGNLTRDPGAIELSFRSLPIGYWKGAGLSLMLDLLAATLSGGLAVFEIPQDPLRESGLSQVFLAIDPFGNGSAIADGIVHALKQADPGAPVRYPGEKVLATRAENLAAGIPVDSALWKELQAMREQGR